MDELKREVTPSGVEILTPLECLKIYARAAAVLQSPAWAKLPSERASVYGDHLDPVFDKLESCAVFQFKYTDSVSRREARELGLEELGPIAGKDIQSVVEKALERRGEKLNASVFKEDAKTPKTLRARAKKDLDLGLVEQANMSWAYHHKNVPGESGDFYTRNTIDSLAKYLKALDTLAGATPKPFWFESLLQKALNKPEYATQGYPHDLLAHDARDVDAGLAVYGIAYKANYLSTYLMKSETDTEMLSGMGEFRMALNPDYEKEQKRSMQKSAPLMNPTL